MHYESDKYPTTTLIGVRSALPTGRDIARVVFRQLHIIAGTTLVLLAISYASGLLTPKYESELKILVRHDRAEPLISSQQNAQLHADTPEISEEELNSEVELLHSQDLLRKVVIALQYKDPASVDERSVDRGVKELSKHLVVEPLRRTNIIGVKYQSRERAQAARVLESLAVLYKEKHLAVHRSSGEMAFFDHEANRYATELAEAQAKLIGFTRDFGIVSADRERELTVERLNAFKAGTYETNASIAELGQRIRNLEQQLTLMPERVVTQVRTTDNAQLLQQLRSTLLTLQLKRTDLLNKYAPTHRLVLDVDRQIENATDAIAGQDEAPLKDSATDRNPTRDLVAAELSRTRAQFVGMQAKAEASRRMVTKYDLVSRDLMERSIEQGNLLRTAKDREETYLLYSRKREEARINEALDAHGILNVAVAEHPTVPILPARSAGLLFGLGLSFALSAGFGAAFMADVLDQTYRTPGELTSSLGLPVIASLPGPTSKSRTRGYL
jgi:uncharacterized protein involved in exopolysaccharide biosynthesis